MLFQRIGKPDGIRRMTTLLLTPVLASIATPEPAGWSLDIRGPWDFLLILAGLGFGLLVGSLLYRMATRRSLGAARDEAATIVRNAEQEALTRSQKVELESEKKATGPARGT